MTDLNDNHGGIDINGSVDSVVESSLYPLGINLDAAQRQWAWVDYDGATNLLEVRVASSNVRPAAAFMSYSVDLPALLGGGGPDVEDALIDCDGNLVTDLTPTVHLDKVDSNPDGSVNEPLITEVATNGKQMRWLDTFYHYTLSTKNSQFAAGGRWR